MFGPPSRKEQLLDGGTRVRLKLLKDPSERGGVLQKRGESPSPTLSELCSFLCPALDIDLFVADGGPKEKVVGAADWKSMDGSKLLARMKELHTGPAKANLVDLLDFRTRAASNLRLLTNDNGEVVGRACISAGGGKFSDGILDLGGIVTVGGLESCSLRGIIGILEGVPRTASRDTAVPLVSSSALVKWASEQSDLIPNIRRSPGEQIVCAQFVHLCGGDTGRLPICRNLGLWLSGEEVAALPDLPNEVLMVAIYWLDSKLEELPGLEVEASVFATEASGVPLFAIAALLRA